MSECACGTKKTTLPEEQMEACKMQGHWLLAKMGKRVLRPGGIELTRQMLMALGISARDHVVEFAPGLGVTARMTLNKNPASYTAIEKEEAAAARVSGYLQGNNHRCLTGLAEDTGLEAESATVVYGEAMLTMHPDRKKLEIIREAARILKPGGRYGIHEVAIIPDDADSYLQKEIRAELSRSIHIGASPATISHWRKLLEDEGFEVEHIITTPFHLLEPKRIIQDEGLAGALKFAGNLLRHGQARKIILDMKKVFKKYRQHLNGMTMVAVKRGDAEQRTVGNAMKEETTDQIHETKVIDLADFTEFRENKFYHDIVSDSPYAKILTYCFEPGQELPVHSHPADSQLTIFVLEGEGFFTGGEEDIPAKTGRICVGMVSTPHGVRAETRMRILVIITPTI
jgi:quercetin dioxygenase-like cupin family protein/ubiquinone/menaquinone biosynthesis C-methylase UbiE